MTRTIRLGRLLTPREDPDHPDLPVLSVYREHGVVPKASRSDNFNKTPEDLSRYLRVEPDDLVVNKMKAWSGSVGVSRFRGIVSGDYLVCKVASGLEPRFLHHALRSTWLIGEMRMRSRGIRPSQERLYWEDLAAIALPLPTAEEQRRIADFLDDQVGLIDAAVDAVRAVRALASDRILAKLEADLLDPAVPGVLPWRREVVLAPVGAKFALALGKMLNEERAGGARLRPYLRNTNVQWDRIDIDDLKQMEFSAAEKRRYEVLPGDLLICEGGQPGRAAAWDGRVAEIYFQKALHRARPRHGDLPRWLLYCLRVCVRRSAFSDAGGTTIAHLTGEQLQALRLPFPPAERQSQLVRAWDEMQQWGVVVEGECWLQESLLEERKRALITACVTGEFDVSTAGNRAAQAAMQGVGA